MTVCVMIYCAEKSDREKCFRILVFVTENTNKLALCISRNIFHHQENVIDIWALHKWGKAQPKRKIVASDYNDFYKSNPMHVFHPHNKMSDNVQSKYCMDVTISMTSLKCSLMNIHKLNESIEWLQLCVFLCQYAIIR